MRDPPRGADPADSPADFAGLRVFPVSPTSRPSNLDEAAQCELRARRLWPFVEELREAIRLGDACLGAAAAIEEILSCNRSILDNSRMIADGRGRGALAGTFETMRRQIDLIAAEAGTREKNLALGDVLAVSFGEAEGEPLQTPVMDFSAAGLGIDRPAGDFQSDEDLLVSMTQIDRALDRVRSDRTVLEMLFSVVKSREKLLRHTIAALRERTWSLSERDVTLARIHDLAGHAEDGAPSPPPPPAPRAETVAATPAAAPTANDNAAGERTVSQGSLERARALIGSLDRSSIVDALNELSLELARALDPDNHIANWVKFDNGERHVFLRRLAASYGPATIETAAGKYNADDAFRAYADEYVRLFESLVPVYTGGDLRDKENIEKLLKTDCGTVYTMLAKAIGRV